MRKKYRHTLYNTVISPRDLDLKLWFDQGWFWQLQGYFPDSFHQDHDGFHRGNIPEKICQFLKKQYLYHETYTSLFFILRRVQICSLQLHLKNLWGTRWQDIPEVDQTYRTGKSVISCVTFHAKLLIFFSFCNSLFSYYKSGMCFHDDISLTGRN